jgi:hypothetical protein
MHEVKSESARECEGISEREEGHDSDRKKVGRERKTNL